MGASASLRPQIAVAPIVSAVVLALGLLLGSPLAASAASEVLPDLTRPDGSPITAYLDRQGRIGPQGLILLAQGSGCGSVQGNENIKRAKALLLPEFAALTVEDYGVHEGDPDRLGTGRCGDAVYQHHTISQRVADVLEVLRALRRAPWWNGELVLFGGSEGGAVVQELAPVAPAQAVVVYSSATGLKFRDAFVQTLPPPLAAQATAALAHVRAEPTSSKVLLGNSYRWWADIIDRRLSDDLLRANEPILVVQGERDQSNPVASARAVREAFRVAGRCNLTYVELPGYDHHMVDLAGVDHFEAVMGTISAWLRRQLAASPRRQGSPEGSPDGSCAGG